MAPPARRLAHAPWRLTAALPVATGVDGAGPSLSAPSRGQRPSLMTSRRCASDPCGPTIGWQRFPRWLLKCRCSGCPSCCPGRSWSARCAVRGWEAGADQPAQPGDRLTRPRADPALGRGRRDPGVSLSCPRGARGGNSAPRRRPVSLFSGILDSVTECAEELPDAVSIRNNVFSQFGSVWKATEYMVVVKAENTALGYCLIFPPAVSGVSGPAFE